MAILATVCNPCCGSDLSPERRTQLYACGASILAAVSAPVLSATRASVSTAMGEAVGAAVAPPKQSSYSWSVAVSHRCRSSEDSASVEVSKQFTYYVSIEPTVSHSVDAYGACVVVELAGVADG